MEVIQNKQSTKSYRILSQIKAGKSGDLVFRVTLNGAPRILKASRKEQGLKKEIEATTAVSDLFQKSKNPIVQILDSGKMQYKNQTYYFYTMEDLSSPYRLLRDVILENCTKRTQNLEKIFWNIFNVLKTMKLKSWSHCDLHTENIFVHPDGHVKIIDFGLASPKACSKQRKLTEAIAKNQWKCRRSAKALKTYLSMLTQWTNRSQMDSDLSMFVSILSILYGDDNNLHLLLQLHQFSTQIAEADNKLRQKLLQKFETVLSLILEE